MAEVIEKDIPVSCVCASGRREVRENLQVHLHIIPSSPQALLPWGRHSKSRFFCAVKTSVLKFCARKSGKVTPKITYYVWIMKKKLKKVVKMHKFLICAYNSQDFAQTQENFAPSHDGTTVTFRNSVHSKLILRVNLPLEVLFWEVLPWDISP